MSQLLRVQNFTVSSDGFGAGEGQSFEKPFGHADPGNMFAWAIATDHSPINRSEPGGSRGLDDYSVDLLFTVDGANTAVLIDPGPVHGQDQARHLRLMHARGDLLTGLPSGGTGAKFEPVERTVRVPTWRILAVPALLDPLFGKP